jgi:hypothetical protein
MLSSLSNEQKKEEGVTAKHLWTVSLKATTKQFSKHIEFLFGLTS